MNHLSPTNDLIFKKMMTDKKNEEILLNFVRDFTGKPFESVEAITNYNYYLEQVSKEMKKVQESNPDNPEKQLRETIIGFTEVDVRGKLDTGEIVTIEVQVRPENYFVNRSQYYLFEGFNMNFENPEGNHEKPTREERYNSLKSVYGINITNFDPLGSNQAYSSYVFKEVATGERIDAHLENIESPTLIYLNLKSQNYLDSYPGIDLEKIKHWQDFFNEKELSLEAPDYIKKASQHLNFMTLSREEYFIMSSVKHGFVTVQDAIEAGIEYHKAEIERDLQKKYDVIVNEKDQAINEKDQLIKKKDEDRQLMLKKMLSHFSHEELISNFEFSLDEIQEAEKVKREQLERIRMKRQRDLER